MPSLPPTHRPAHLPPAAAVRREHDAKRRDTKPWRAWYNLARWREIRAAQLRAEPLCRMCLAEDVVRAATVCDHVEPHHGDPDLFWNGERQSLCKPHHDRDKQRDERGRRRVGG